MKKTISVILTVVLIVNCLGLIGVFVVGASKSAGLGNMYFGVYYQERETELAALRALRKAKFDDYGHTEVKGVKYTRQGRGHWVREFQEWDINRLSKYEASGFNRAGVAGENALDPGERAYMMIGDFVDDDPGAPDADHVQNEAGWITITPCTLDHTDYAELERLTR